MSVDAKVILHRGRARPLWFGHPWAYANGVERIEGAAEPGDVVALHDHDGRFIGKGLWNPRSQIRVRLLTRADEAIDATFFRAALDRARARRARVGLPSARTTAYRLVNAEGDGLPGLVVDVFGDALAVQITTLGMWLRRELVYDALAAALRPRAIVQVAGGAFADVEGFAAAAGVVRGVETARAACLEDDVKLEVELQGAQKTGMYLDQRPSRVRVGQLARGARVLDCYSYAGGFALQAARGGAREVTAVDTSARAVARIEAHARANHAAVAAVEADSFRFLEAATRESYDLVIIDPPKFARARKDLEAARKGYERLNALAMQACAPGALLLTCSCSQNVSAEDFERVVAAGAKHAGREVAVLERLGPGADHPLPPGFTEGQYLKVLLCYVA